MVDPVVMDLHTEPTASFEPAPEHVRLARIEGTWTGTSKTWLEPGKSPEEEPWRGTFALVLGGRFLRIEYASRAMGGPIAGELVVAYEPGDARWRTGFESLLGAPEGLRGASEALPVASEVLEGTRPDHFAFWQRKAVPAAFPSLSFCSRRT